MKWNREIPTTDGFDGDQIVDLDDGFQRLGDVESPFTLRTHPDKKTSKQKRARKIHEQRPRAKQLRDESRHEPITRDLEEWRKNMDTRDFPNVDTVPPELRRQRANAAEDIARSSFGLNSVEHGVGFSDPNIRGKYFRGIGEIETNTSDDDFPGWGEATTLAHEVGHAVDNNSNSKIGFASERGEVFRTKEQKREATKLSERVRGPISAFDIPNAKNYRHKLREKTADTFASMVIEPERAEEIAPNATTQLKSTFDGFFDELSIKQEQINDEWLID